MAARRKKVLDVLRDDEAAVVLRQLLVRHPELVPEVEAIAKDILPPRSRDAVAEAVAMAILAVTLDDIWDRSGRQDDRYVAENEAAWDVFEAVMKPFEDDVVRLVSIGHMDDARITVEGILIGLYSLPDPREHEALARAEDWPADAAGTIAGRWTAASGGALDEAFVLQHLPDWGFLARKPRKRR